jgi:hypothetical protein
MINIAYTTLEIQLSKDSLQLKPYFKRPSTVGPLSLNISVDHPIELPFYDLTNIVYKPEANKSQVFFYLYQNGKFYSLLLLFFDFKIKFYLFKRI